MGDYKDFQAEVRTSMAESRGKQQALEEKMREISIKGNSVRWHTELVFPKYDGSCDPLRWLLKCESYFDLLETPKTGMVRLASFHLTEAAEMWFCNFRHLSSGIISWEEFSAQCKDRFGLVNYNALGELARLQQRGTVMEYTAEFESLLIRTKGLLPEHVRDLFTAGLIDSLRFEVEIREPRDMYAAMKVARIFEKKPIDNEGQYA